MAYSLVQLEQIAQASGFPTLAEWRIGSDSHVYKVNTPEAEKAPGLGPTVSVSRIMAFIAMRESRGNPRAHNPVPPDNSYGLWQINMLAHSKSELGIPNNEALYDPYINGRAALQIFNDAANHSGKTAYSAQWIEAGLKPWTTRSAALRDLYKQGASVPSNTHEAGLYPGQLQLEDAIGNIGGGIANVGKFLGILMSGGFWRRIGLGALAVVIIAFAIVFYSDNINIQPPK